MLSPNPCRLIVAKKAWEVTLQPLHKAQRIPGSGSKALRLHAVHE